MKKLFFIVLSVFLMGGVFGLDNFALAQTSTSTTATTASDSTSSGTLSCGPLLRTLQAGQSVTLNATGGNGTYAWTATGLTTTYPGSSFTLTYPNPGTSIVTLTSGTQAAFCSIKVSPVGSFPELPSTGGGSLSTNIFWPSLFLGIITLAVYLASMFKKESR